MRAFCRRFWAGGSSFPSGHSMSTWALASVIAHEYPRPRAIPIAAYVLAATVSVSRVGERRHFPADAAAGAAIGWFIGDFVFSRSRRAAVGAPPSKVGKLLSHVLGGPPD